MTTEERVRRIESKIEELRIDVDGGQHQTREAVIVAIGLVLSLLAGESRLDLDALIASLAATADPDRNADDHVGIFIDDLRLALEFHRDREAGTLAVRVPITELLSPSEIAEMCQRAEALVAYEKSSEKEAKLRKRKARRATSRPPVH